MEKLKLGKKKSVIVGDMHIHIVDEWSKINGSVVTGHMVGHYHVPSKWQTGFGMIHGSVSPGLEPRYSISYTETKNRKFFDTETACSLSPLGGKAMLYLS